ncbi:uncharacterized protein LOC131883082 [Tigriopus californicus]|uniref:uncharacterized protein LOC131883082 n=1 Tax=Tigriopus californicus TaxID=6832 RepID=UPI0027D9D952|nr:uncharacterized protein LOC131883082 [Tigriopus californicus]
MDAFLSEYQPLADGSDPESVSTAESRVLGVFLLNSHWVLRYLLVAFNALALFFGTWFKLVIVCHLRNTGKNRSINWLIYVDQLVGFTGIVIGLVQMRLFSSDTPTSELLGNGSCVIYQICVLVHLTFAAFGGFGIAFFRVLYIHMNRITENKTCLLALCTAVIVIELLLTAVFSTLLYQFPLYDTNINMSMCLGQKHMIRLVGPFFHYGKWVRNVYFVTLFFFNTFEFACYVLTFIYLFQHERQMLRSNWRQQASLQNRQIHNHQHHQYHQNNNNNINNINNNHKNITIKIGSRRRRHIVTMQASFLGWSIENAILVTFLIIKLVRGHLEPNSTLELSLTLYPMSLYVFMPAIQLLCSREIRAEWKLRFWECATIT